MEWAVVTCGDGSIDPSRCTSVEALRAGSVDPAPQIKSIFGTIVASHLGNLVMRSGRSKIILGGLILILSGQFIIACNPVRQRYVLRGKVLGVDAIRNEITIKHEAIPGYMDAMTMPFKVKDPAILREVEPGDLIVADLVIYSSGSGSVLENIRVTDSTGRKAGKVSSQVNFLKIGDRVPDLTLTNQDGRKFSLADFPGKAVLITFIYTRCPYPEFCPRLSGEFAEIHHDLAQTPADYRRTHLVSISIDPKHDTESVLRDYGLRYLNNDPSGFQHWDFAYTQPDDLSNLAQSFGLAYFEMEREISHSMVIALIAPDGTIAKHWARDWTLPDVESTFRSAAKMKPGERLP